MHWIRMPVGARFPAPVRISPEAHPDSYKTSPGSFPGVEEQAGGFNRPFTSSVEVKERVAIPLLPLWTLTACYIGESCLLLVKIRLCYEVLRKMH